MLYMSNKSRLVVFILIIQFLKIFIIHIFSWCSFFFNILQNAHVEVVRRSVYNVISNLMFICSQFFLLLAHSHSPMALLFSEELLISAQQLVFTSNYVDYIFYIIFVFLLKKHKLIQWDSNWEIFRGESHSCYVTFIRPDR